MRSASGRAWRTTSRCPGRSSRCSRSSRRSSKGLSLDEAFLDVTASIAAFGAAESIAAEIKRRIRADTALTCSVGVAPNKLVAKIASELEKARRPGRRSTGAVSTRCSIRCRCGGCSASGPRPRRGSRRSASARSASSGARRSDVLRPVFGRYAERIQQRAAGIDDRPVVPDLEEVQISTEETFDTDIARPGAAARRADPPGRPQRRAAARARACCLVRDGQDPARRFHDLHETTAHRAADPGNARDLEGGCRAARRLACDTTACSAAPARRGREPARPRGTARSLHRAGIGAQPGPRPCGRPHPRALRAVRARACELVAGHERARRRGRRTSATETQSDATRSGK